MEFKESGKYRIELFEEVPAINCRIFKIYREGEFYDCILEIDGVFELVSNYHREDWVFDQLVKFIQGEFCKADTISSA